MTAIAHRLGLLVVCLGTACYGQDAPKIDGPTEVAAHRLVRLSVAGNVESCTWIVSGVSPSAREVDTEPEDGVGPKVAFAGPPGTYRVDAVVLIGAAQRRLPARYVTIRESDEPDTLPGEDPPPPAAVSPIRQAGKVYSARSGEMLRAAAKWVRENPTADKVALKEWLKARKAPIAESFEIALDEAMRPHVNDDENGTFRNAAGVAKALDEAGRGVGSP